MINECLQIEIMNPSTKITVNKNNSVCLRRSRSIPTIFGNRTRRFRYGFFISLALSRGQLLLSRFLEAGRINPSQIRWRPRKQFASLSLSLVLSPFVCPPSSPLRSAGTSSCNVRTLNDPGCRVLGVSWWFSWRYPTIAAISQAAVMCLPCLRLIRVV